jgi:hypothetical protein
MFWRKYIFYPARNTLQVNYSAHVWGLMLTNMQLQGIPEQIQKVLLSTKHSLFYPKSGLLNGHNSVNFDGHFYLKVAKTSLFSNRTVEEFSLGCSISKLSNLWTEHSQKSSKWIVKFCPSICLRSWSSRVSCHFLSLVFLATSPRQPWLFLHWNKL